MDTRRREEVLEAAGGLFARFGFKRVSMEEVARAAGVAKGTLYLVAASKEELFVEAVIWEVERFLAFGRKARGRLLPGPGALRQLVSALLEELRTRPLLHALFLTRLELDVPTRAADLRALRLGAFGALEEVVAEAVDRGHLRPELEPGPVARLLLEGACLGEIFDPGDASEGRSQFTLDVLMRGLMP